MNISVDNMAEKSSGNCPMFHHRRGCGVMVVAHACSHGSAGNLAMNRDVAHPSCRRDNGWSMIVTCSLVRIRLRLQRLETGRSWEYGVAFTISLIPLLWENTKAILHCPLSEPQWWRCLISLDNITVLRSYATVQVKNHLFRPRTGR